MRIQPIICGNKKIDSSKNNYVIQKKNILSNDKVNFTSKLPYLKELSFQLNPYLDEVNNVVQKQCEKMTWNKDTPDLAKWLFAKSNKIDLSNLKSLDGVNNAQAWIINTCGIVERQIRRTIAKQPPNTIPEKFKMYGDSLKKLSDTYRAQFDFQPEKPYLLEIAHDSAKKSLDEYGTVSYNKLTYRQSNAHRFHLNVGVPSLESIEMYKQGNYNPASSYKEYFEKLYSRIDYDENLLKLCLSFNEAEAGVHNSYKEFLLRDLINVQEMRGDKNRVNIFSNHADQVIKVEDEPGIWLNERTKKHLKGFNNPLIKIYRRFKSDIRFKIYLLQEDKIEKRFGKEDFRWTGNLLPKQDNLDTILKAETFATDSIKSLEEQLDNPKLSKSNRKPRTTPAIA